MRDARLDRCGETTSPLIPPLDHTASFQSPIVNAGGHTFSLASTTLSSSCRAGSVLDLPGFAEQKGVGLATAPDERGDHGNQPCPCPPLFSTGAELQVEEVMLAPVCSPPTSPLNELVSRPLHLCMRGLPCLPRPAASPSPAQIPRDLHLR